MAKKTNADIFVSIHFNTAQNPVARGVEIFYYKDRKSFRRTSQSLELGNCIMKQLCKHLKSPSRGVRSGDFCVIRETCMPAVLVELGFLSNPIDVQRLQNSTYRQQISMAIANGIQEYFSKR
jgi:N-acetylmuramoyl-L-alanine amidase